MTAAQQAELERIARGVEIDGAAVRENTPMRRLVGLGLLTIREHDGKHYAKLTTQALVMMAKGFG